MEKLLLYCTHGELLEEHWRKFDGIGKFILYEHSDKVKYSNPNSSHRMNGKVVASCECDLVEPFTTDYRMDKEQTMRISKDSCLTLNEMSDYENRGGNCRCLYGHHLKNVNVFYKPKELSDYGLKKAPQNMCYVYDENGNKCILLSVHPKPLSQILNGEKTIEVRRKILNALKELIK